MVTNLAKETELSINHICKVGFPRNAKDLEIHISCKRKVSNKVYLSIQDRKYILIKKCQLVSGAGVGGNISQIIITAIANIKTQSLKDAIK